MTRSHTVTVALGTAIVLAAAALSAAALAADPTPPLVPIAPPPQIVKTSTLPGDGDGALGLAAFQNAALPGTATAAIPNSTVPTRPDRLVNLGGIGSDLFQAPGTSSNDFYMVTDRGPNGETTARTFPTPWFTPTILHARASGPDLKILSSFPIVGSKPGATPCTTPVGGLPNLGGTVKSPADGSPYDDAPLAYDGTTNVGVGYTPSGLDTEGLVRAGDGSFWFVEEYSPSLGHVSSKGCLLERIVPRGLPLTSPGALAPVTDSIPTVFQLRKKNRGFEALALSPSGRYLFVGLQSPLLNPTTSAGNASRNTRILRYNHADGRFDAEYAYRFDDPATFPRDSNPMLAAARTQDLKLSALVALDDDTLLVLERTDLLAKVYLAELSGASNVLGTWDCVGDRPSPPAYFSPMFNNAPTPVTCAGNLSLEQLAAGSDPNTLVNGLRTVAKGRLLTVIDARSGMPEKIEGLVVINKAQIAVANDNDFNVLGGGDGVAFNTTGLNAGNMILRDPTVPSEVLRIKLDEPLPIGG